VSGAGISSGTGPAAAFRLPPHLLVALLPLLALIVALDAGAMLAGIGCGAVYLAFAVAVTALAASLVRNTLATAGIALAVLLLLPIAGTVRAAGAWLPTTLATAPGDLLTRAHPLAHYLPTFAVTVAAGAVALAVAVLRLRAREI
jgi:ABC-2 type transport system permease protein